MTDEFTPVDANIVHAAMMDAKQEAKERAEKMPSSSQAFERRAQNLKILLNKILDRLPPEVRRAYPDS